MTARTCYICEGDISSNMEMMYPFTEICEECIREEKTTMAKPSTETIEITKVKYAELLSDQEFLNALRAEGVDNWDGYDLAIERMDEEE